MENNRMLSGLKVVDFTNFIAAPACSRLLADLGASVIKVESIDGCPWRNMQPNFFFDVNENHNVPFDIYNANKRGISLNLKDPDAKDVLFRLLEQADILVTNTRSDALKKLGLDYDSLKDRFPRLVYALLSGYGEKGPKANQPAYDTVAFWSDSGFLVDMPKKDEFPLSSPIAFGDVASGTVLFGAVCAALYKRELTGKGDLVVASLLGTGVWLNSSLIAFNQPAYGHDTYPPKDRYASNPFAMPFFCKDGEWVILAVTQYTRFRDIVFNSLGLPELTTDPRFQTIASSIPHRAVLTKTMEAAFLKKDSDEWFAIMSAQGVAVSKMAHFCTAAVDEQSEANDYLFDFTYRDGVTARVIGCPIHVGEELECAPYDNAPLLGEHTVEVLQEMGYDAEHINKLLEKKAARQHD